MDPAAAADLAKFFALADEMEREIQAEGINPGDAVDRRFDAPILWPEHFDIAVEAGKGTEQRAVYGASPGDEAHPEPYFYVNPWSKKEHDEFWNATGFNGAILTYAEVLAANDQKAVIREFFREHLRELDAERPPAEREVTAGKAEDLYKGNWASIVNAKLRGLPLPATGLDMDEQQTADYADQVAKALDATIASGPTVGQEHLFRGIDLTDAPGLRERLHKGEVVPDGAFASTTGNEVIAQNFASFHADGIVMKIKVPPDTRNLPIPERDEDEHVLPRGGTFEIASDPYWIKYFGIDIRQVDVIWHPSPTWRPSV